MNRAQIKLFGDGNAQDPGDLVLDTMKAVVPTINLGVEVIQPLGMAIDRRHEVHPIMKHGLDEFSGMTWLSRLALRLLSSNRFVAPIPSVKAWRAGLGFQAEGSHIQFDFTFQLR